MWSMFYEYRAAMDLATTPCFACHFGDLYNFVTMTVVNIDAIVVEPLDISEYHDPSVCSVVNVSLMPVIL